MTKTAYDEVKDVMDTYLKSVRTLDFKLMRSVAHKDGRIFLGNESTSKNLHDHWADDERLFADEERVKFLKRLKVEIFSIEVEGTIANVKMKMGGWYDFHNLVKTPEGWKIITKASHRIE
ncbi:MAG: nuclear transport factor 2 family protein [Candidatus Heimdallarchaeota archaeon]